MTRLAKSARRPWLSRSEFSARDDEMERLYVVGWTLRRIAPRFELTFERVRQILSARGVQMRGRGYRSPNPVQSRTTAYTGPYPIRSGVTCADWFERLPDVARGEG